MCDDYDRKSKKLGTSDAAIRQLMDKVVTTLERHDVKGALKVLEDVLERDPENVEARHEQIKLLIAEGRPKDAIAALRKLVELTPDDASVRWSLGRQLHKTEQFEQAIVSYTKAIEIAPRRAQYYFLRAQCLKALVRSAEALDDLCRSVKLEPGKPEYFDEFLRVAKDVGDYELIIDVIQAASAKAMNPQELQFHLVDALLVERRLDEALSTNRALDTDEAPLFDVGVNFIKLGAFREAKRCFQRELALRPSPTAHGYLNWLHVCALNGNDGQGLKAYLSKLLDDNPQAFINASEFKDEFTPFIQTREHGVSPDPILLNTMPKSGSVYIWRQLSDLLGYPLARISTTNWPVDDIVPAWARAFAQSRTIAQGHFNPSSDNLSHFVRNNIRRMIFHVRDPRQATLSWTHHIDSYLKRGLKNQFWPPLPGSYALWDFEQRLGWNIERHLPLLCRWIVQWDKAFAEEEGFEVLVCTYEEFKSDETAYFRKVFEFLSRDPDEFHYEPPKKVPGRLHFRAGKTSEWKAAFTDRQKALALSLIPGELLRRFSWPEE